MKTKLCIILALLALGFGGSAVWGECCLAPDNGTGTADFPAPDCIYSTPNGDMHILDGLPAGTTIEIDASNGSFICSPGTSICSVPPGANCRVAGGSLGGEIACMGSTLMMPMVGTGALAGFNRMINLPIQSEIHSAPRNPGLSMQSFDTDMFRMFGQITGDPDFDLLRITAGTDFGMRSPGHTTLIGQPGGDWAVDSFFDITYRIDFVGAPGGKLAGRSGSTTGTIRMTTCPISVREVKWIQPPDKTPAGMDIRIDRNDQVPRVVADDFLCTQMGPITDVHFWGSWKGDPPFRLMAQIHLSIHKDIPADPTQPGSYSRPGEVLWEKDFHIGQFVQTLYTTIAPEFEWWWDPYRQDLIRKGDQNIWQYDVYIDPAEAFIQEGTPDDPVVYWLDISVGTEVGQFGWKTASEHWNDDAVYSGPAGAVPWLELIYPTGHPLAGKSIDMAFAITTKPIEEKRQACCLPDGTCANLTGAECVEKGGNPQGPGTNCATTPCIMPIPTEKCCLPNGECANLTAAECRAKGGVSNGPGTACDGLPCPKPCEIPPIVCPSGDKATVISYPAGIADNYVLPVEATSPDATLLNFITTCSAPGIPLQFDQIPGEGSVPANSWLGHTFTGLPNGIVAARLQVRARASKGNGSSGTYNDAICFISSIAGCVPSYSWSNRFANLPEAGGTWNPGQTGTFCLDLAALPTPSGPKNLLSLLASGNLRIFVVDDSGIDAMRLTVAVCPCKYKFPLSTTVGVNNQCQFFSTPAKPASPSTAMTTAMPGLWRQFDEPFVANRRFGHTFTGLPAGIVAAQLEICLKATEDFPENDILYLSFLNPTFAWSKSIPTLTAMPWNVGDQKLLTLDLGNLPPSGAGVTSVLGNMAGGSLDVCIQDDTAVDYITLRYWACCRKTVDGDIDLDGTVNIVDLSIMASNWLVTVP